VQLLTPRAAAQQLGVSYATLKQWIYRGSIRTKRTAGGHHRIPSAEIERMLAGSGRATAKPRPRAGSPRGLRQGRDGRAIALSGRNQLRGIVEEVRVEGLLAQIRIRIGDQSLTAIITRDAADELRLRHGDEAVAVIKATEVMVAR
jgi:molybdopterin-binding protein